MKKLSWVAVIASAAVVATAAPAAGQTPWMYGLFGDVRARAVNDLVTVRVIESIAAVGAADSSLDKDSKAAVGVPNLFGLETRLPGAIDPSALATAGASTTFKGGGSTARSSELSAIITARVVAVLPNGDLQIEGARQIDINGDRQTITLSGIVRTADITPGNVVLSSAVGDMQIRYFGRGLIKDNLSPGWLIRILNKIF